MEEEEGFILGLIDENSGLSLLCKEEGIEITGDKLKALCNSSKANGQSINFMAIAKHWSYVIKEGGGWFESDCEELMGI